jgi:hypothetical protein
LLTNNTLPFTDNFTTATNQQLSNSWLNQQGNFQVSGGVATALTSPVGVDVATVNGINNTNGFVQADVNVAVGQYGGLVARYSGPLDGNMDWADVVNLGGGVFQAQIWQNYHGVWSELFFQNYSGSGTGTLRFEAVGSSLKLFENSNLIAYANDTLLTGGTVGIRSTAGATYDNLSADVLTLTNNTVSFSDGFTTATNQQLSNSWLNQAGSFQVAGGMATGLGSLDVATVNGVSTLNSTLQALVTVNPGQAAGLVSRYSGPGDANMYWAGLVGAGAGSAYAEIWVNVNGNWQLLNFAAVATNSGTLKLVTSGNQLTLFVNNVSTLSITDSSLLSPGTVGMRATAGATIDNFTSL